MTDNLSELWRTARQYGKVILHTNDNGTYHASITFNTVAHTSLEAKSDFKQMTPEAAVQMAIESAQAIVDSVSQVAAAMPGRKMLSETQTGMIAP